MAEKYFIRISGTKIIGKSACHGTIDSIAAGAIELSDEDQYNQAQLGGTYVDGVVYPPEEL